MGMDTIGDMIDWLSQYDRGGAIPTYDMLINLLNQCSMASGNYNTLIIATPDGREIKLFVANGQPIMLVPENDDFYAGH